MAARVLGVELPREAIGHELGGAAAGEHELDAGDARDVVAVAEPQVVEAEEGLAAGEVGGSGEQELGSASARGAPASATVTNVNTAR